MIIASSKIDKGFSGKLETLFQTVSCSQELLVQTILWNRVPSLPLPWCLSVALLRPHGLLGVALLGLHVLLGLPFLLGTQGVLSLIVIVIRNHEYITILLHLLLPERGNHQPLPPGWRLLQLGSQLPQTSGSRYQPAYPWSPPVQAEKKCANNKQFFTENFSKLKLLYKSMCVLPTIRTSQEFQVAVKLCPSRTLGTASHPLGQWNVHHPRPQTLCCRLWVPLPHCSPFWTCQVGRMWPRRRAMNNMRI